MECKYLLPLTVVLLIYLCVGAAIFQATESTKEQASTARMLALYQRFISNHTCVTRESLTEFIESVLEQVGPYGGLARAKFDVNLTKVNSRQVWDYPGAFTFSVTVITTIGYGHIYPVSPLGKIMCVVYAIVGIPITLLVLRGIGEQLNKIGQKIMSLKLCFKSASVNKAINIACVVFAGIMVMFLIPTIIFNLIEDWDVLKCLYYCFITLSTIGFGDFVAGDADKITNEDWRNIYRIMVYLWILVGLAYISLIIKSISDLFIKKAEQVQKEAKRVASTRLATLGTGPISAIAALGTHIESNNENGHTSHKKDPSHTSIFKQRGLKRLRLRSDIVSFDKDKDIDLVQVSSINENDNSLVCLTVMNDVRKTNTRENNKEKPQTEGGVTGQGPAGPDGDNSDSTDSSENSDSSDSSASSVHSENSESVKTDNKDSDVTARTDKTEEEEQEKQEGEQESRNPQIGEGGGERDCVDSAPSVKNADSGDSEFPKKEEEQELDKVINSNKEL